MNPDHEGPFTKHAPGSGKLGRNVRAAERRAERRREERKAQLAAIAAAKELRRQVWARDKGKCRACRTPVKLVGETLEVGQAHHVCFRSQGGENTTRNLAMLCVTCHMRAHNGMLEVVGDADGLLTVTQYEFRSGTRKLLRTWGS